MVDLTDCADLPDAIDQDVVERELDGLLSKYWGSSDPAVVECIYELALRQANNFALIDERLRMKLSDYILKVWDKDSVDSTESCLAVIVNFGLQSAYDYLLSNASNVQNAEVRKEIDNTLNDIGTNVEDMGF